MDTDIGQTVLDVEWGDHTQVVDVEDAEGVKRVEVCASLDRLIFGHLDAFIQRKRLTDHLDHASFTLLSDGPSEAPIFSEGRISVCCR